MRLHSTVHGNVNNDRKDGVLHYAVFDIAMFDGAVYYYTLSAGTSVSTKKMILLK